MKNTTVSKVFLTVFHPCFLLPSADKSYTRETRQKYRARMTRAWCVWRSQPAGKIDPSAVPRHRPWSIRRSRGLDTADRDAERHETPG